VPHSENRSADALQRRHVGDGTRQLIRDLLESGAALLARNADERTARLLELLEARKVLLGAQRAELRLRHDTRHQRHLADNWLRIAGCGARDRRRVLGAVVVRASRAAHCSHDKLLTNDDALSVRNRVDGVVVAVGTGDEELDAIDSDAQLALDARHSGDIENGGELLLERRGTVVGLGVLKATLRQTERGAETIEKCEIVTTGERDRVTDRAELGASQVRLEVSERLLVRRVGVLTIGEKANDDLVDIRWQLTNRGPRHRERRAKRRRARGAKTPNHLLVIVCSISHNFGARIVQHQSHIDVECKRALGDIEQRGHNLSLKIARH
jgi:hypothetical protein